MQDAPSVTAPSQPVELGRAFPLVVERRLPKEGRIPTFDESGLAPLIVRLESTERTEKNGAFVEMRRYEARAFQTGSVAIGSSGAHVEVASALPAGDTGQIELPPGPLALPFPWGRTLAWSGAALLALAAAALLVRRLRRKKPSVAPAAPPKPADVRARERLAALRARDPQTDEEIQRFYVEVSSIVRDYVEERFRVRAPEMTTDEFLASPRTRETLAPAHRSMLAEFLGHCDLVKFARAASARPDRERLVESADRFVGETRDAAPLAVAA